MRTYKIEVKETLSRVVKIKSNSINNALSIVNEKYDKEEIVLDYNDFKTLDIDLLELKNVENSPIFSDFLLKNAENMITSLSLEELAIIAFGSLNEAIARFESN
jgi:hypothetical protein